MKWIAISGGWKTINNKIEDDVRSVVEKIISRGDGIVSGGALNVDFIATDEALKLDPTAKKIKVFLPTTFEKFKEHYRKHARLGTITSEEAENLIKQLTRLKQINKNSLIENPNTNFTEETKKKMYYERNGRVIDASHELVAFHIKTKFSKGEGTMDTIEKARKKGIPVKVFNYNININ